MYRCRNPREGCRHDRVGFTATAPSPRSPPTLGGTVGVAARNLASGAEVHVDADELFPMASCFKIPVMVEVMRQVDAGALRLDDRLTLTEADKSPGSTLHPLSRGTAPERARPPLPDDHAERQHGHRHALAAGRPRRRSTRPCAASAWSPSTASCPTASTSSSSRARATSGPASAGPRSSPAGGRSRRAGTTRTSFRRVLEESARLSGAGFLHRTSTAGAETDRSATRTPSPSTRRSTTRARRATWPRCWR